MDVKENFLETLRWGKPEALVNSWEPFGMVFDPLMAMTLVARRGETVIDPWGVSVYQAEDEPGVMPIINDETKVIKDITKWKEVVKAPDIAGVEHDWSAALAMQKQVREAGKLSTTLMATGLFEQSHYLMGFEDALLNLMMEPQAMHELLDYLTEYKLAYCKLIVENLQPDVVLAHDDWGFKSNLFMRDTVWREFFKPRYAKIYGYLKENGIIVMHHSDSFGEPIVPDMVEIGIDIWQGILPQNDIPKLQKITYGKMLLMGGIDSALVDIKDYDEEVIRAEVRRACDTYVPGGGFIPCLTYGGEGSIYPGVNDIIMDEIRKISPTYFQNAPAAVR